LAMALARLWADQLSVQSHVIRMLILFSLQLDVALATEPRHIESICLVDSCEMKPLDSLLLSALRACCRPNECALFDCSGEIHKKSPRRRKLERVGNSDDAQGIRRRSTDPWP
jgi:hypothetical protein